MQSEPISFRTKGEQRLAFLFVCVGVFALTYGILYVVDFLPEKPRSGAVSGEYAIAVPKPIEEPISLERETPVTGQFGDATTTHEDVSHSVHTEPYREDATDTEIDAYDLYPRRIVFDALDGKEVTVLNPESRSVEALDTALLSGVVRHPDSADFERVGTIFLFGHSSYLPNVVNKNFQAFNGIHTMTWGDTIRLFSHDTEYVYRVDRVYEASADVAEIKIQSGKGKLTLVTCDSFGAKTDRFVLEATLVSTRSL